LENHQTEKERGTSKKRQDSKGFWEFLKEMKNCSADESAAQGRSPWGEGSKEIANVGLPA